MAKKAKTLTKTGRKRTGSTRGSGKRRSERERARATTARHGKRVAGPARKRAAKRATATKQTRRSAAKRGPALVLSAPPQRPRRRTPKTVRNQATSVTEAGSGPALPLRDLVRDGMPRSAKAHRAQAVPEPIGRERRRSRTAHGLRHGAMMLPNVPRPMERYGFMRTAVPKR